MSAEETKKPSTLATNSAQRTTASNIVQSSLTDTLSSGKMLKVTLLKSPIRSRHNHKDTIKALGLHRINDSHTLPDNAAVRGMITTVRQWVKFEEVNQ